MKLRTIIKGLRVRHSDSDSYITLTLELDTTDVDLNKLYNLKHKKLELELKEY